MEHVGRRHAIISQQKRPDGSPLRTRQPRACIDAQHHTCCIG